MMALNSDFTKAVAEGRMWEVYQRLVDIMPIDPSLREQDEMLKYAERKIPNLYQPHDEENLLHNISDWTTKYYDDQRYRLEKNFSRERLELLRNMTKHRYSDTIKYRAEQEREYQRARVRPQKQVIEPKCIGVGAAVVGAVVVGIGISVGSTAVKVIGGVVAVGGIAAAVVNSKK